MHPTLIRILFALLTGFGASAQALAVDCRDTLYDRNSYTVCTVSLDKDELQIFYSQAENIRPQTFNQVEALLRQEGRGLDFAVNGGIFSRNFEPTGLLIMNGQQVMPLNLLNWPKHPRVPQNENGNFYVMPNGVFWIEHKRASIANSMKFKLAHSKPDLAIQSGPLLLEEGKVPAILREFNAKNFKRNGVCVRDGASVTFAISNVPVSIRTFAEFMKTGLHCSAALYLDGCRSALFSRQLGRNDPSCPTPQAPAGMPMGAIVGVSSAKHGNTQSMDR